MRPFERKGREKLSTGDLGEIKGKVAVVVVEREGGVGLIQRTRPVIISRMVHCRFLGTTTAIIVFLIRKHRPRSRALPHPLPPPAIVLSRALEVLREIRRNAARKNARFALRLARPNAVQIDKG
jgi:hypothetical protein